MNKLSLIPVALLLSACGGGSHDHGPTVPPTPGPVLDAFYLRINVLVAGAPEDTEPQEVDMVNVTEPETTEPVGG